MKNPTFGIFEPPYCIWQFIFSNHNLKKKEIDKNRKDLIPEYMLMDLPLIVLIIESSFLHLNIV